MARIFVTGSSDGLGLAAARRLLAEGHEVVLHARNDARARDARAAAPRARAVLTGDLASLAQVRALADAANRAGPFDAVIHNAGVGYRERRIETSDGVEHVFAINVLAPYLLTALITRPPRLIYLSSGMHRGGEVDFDDLQWRRRRWNGSQAYSDTKLYDAVLAFAIARRWPKIRSNAVDPGWVATRMGGPGAPDDFASGVETQVWLAVSDDSAAQVSGAYFYHRRPRESHRATHDAGVQDQLLSACEALSGVALPPA